MRLLRIIILVITFSQAAITVPQARNAYIQSANGKKAALKFEQILDSVREDAAPVLVCYKGAAEMLKAKNTANPISKFACFNRGKNLIEQSLARDNFCIESHFIRYTIQRNLPGFLNYNKNIYQDSLFITNGLDNSTDEDLKSKISAYFNRRNTHHKNEQ